MARHVDCLSEAVSHEANAIMYWGVQGQITNGVRNMLVLQLKEELGEES